jgi:predicted dehydrogenase
MSQDLRVGCIGAGYFSRFHYDAWRRIAGVVPVAAVDRDLPLAQATGLAAYDDAATMLTAQRPDIVDIITPPPSHLPLIRAALEAGAQAVICQKPFCTSLDEAEQAARLSADAGVPVIVHENFRFQPWYRATREAIAAGQLGDVQQVTFRLRPGDGQGPQAYLDRQPYFQQMERFLIHETAVHWVDTFRFLLGEPEEVLADLRRMNPVIAGEDAGHVIFAYAGGRRALFDGNRLLDHAAENTRCTMGEALVEGTQGTLSLAGDGSVTLRRFGDLSGTEILAPDQTGVFGGDCVYHLQAHVVRSLREGTTPENTAEAYLPVIRTEAAIYQSAEERRWVAL